MARWPISDDDARDMDAEGRGNETARWYARQWNRVFRLGLLPSAFFLRSPDEDGRSYWTNRYLSGELSLPGVATNFAGSPEFQGRYGQLDDAQFVRLVYQNVLEREVPPRHLSGRPLMGLGWSSRTDARNLEIESGGGWAIAIAPLSFAQQMGNEVTGRGGTVLRVDRGPGVVAYNHNGSRNFIVWSYSGERSHLFANEIGPVSGQRVLDGVPGYLQVEADGDWTLRFG